MARSLAIKPDPDPDRRRNLAMAAAVFGVVVLIAVGQAVARRSSTLEVVVAATGYAGAPMKAVVELCDLSGQVVAHGETDSATGMYVSRLRPGTYRIEATVPVKETEIGLPNLYPVHETVTVLEGAQAPVRVELKFGDLEPYPGFPGRYHGHR
jgi:hypothetical protein